MTVAALVLGAGSGERFHRSRGAWGGTGHESGGALPKAFVSLAGRTLLARSLATLAAAPEIARVVPVLPPDAEGLWDLVRSELADATKLAAPVRGGATRADSTRRGLERLDADVTHVAVHDAARPLVRTEDVRRVVQAALEGGAALLAVPCPDTVHRVEDGRVVETPPRTACWAAQTPQVFRVDWLREALRRAEAEGRPGTDDAELVARLGVPVRVVEGDPANLKITRASDLAAAEALLKELGRS